MTHFETTRWSIVRAAASNAPAEAGMALETLCATYWRPLYLYIRHQGHSPEDAKDLTQGFFARFLERNYLSDLDPDKGKFRSFLMASVSHFLSNERDRAKTLKRGGSVGFLPIDYTTVEERYIAGASSSLSPERLFDRAWALASLQSALMRLRREYEGSGRGQLFDRLKATLTTQAERSPYSEVGAEFGLSEEAVKATAHRLRRRYRELVREEVAHTLAEGESVEEELCYLFTALGA